MKEKKDHSHCCENRTPLAVNVFNMLGNKKLLDTMCIHKQFYASKYFLLSRHLHEPQETAGLGWRIFVLFVSISYNISYSLG